MVLALDLLDDPCVRLWRRRLPKSFDYVFRTFRKWYFEDLQGDSFFGGLSPSELVDWQCNARGREAVRLRVRVQLWIEEKKHLRFKSKQRYFSDICSFFCA